MRGWLSAGRRCQGQKERLGDGFKIVTASHSYSIALWVQTFGDVGLEYKHEQDAGTGRGGREARAGDKVVRHGDCR